MSLVSDKNRWVSGICTPYLGGDPEFFITDKKGTIIGSEKFLPEKGLLIDTSAVNKIVRDGVQAEINIRPDPCRATIGNTMRTVFANLKKQLDASKEFNASFTSVVTVSEKEMKSLSDQARQLGCAPSKNIHNPDAKIVVKDGFRERAAGGHIHLGINGYHELMNQREKLVRIMDVIVGNTCVLIDRDPLQAKRRKVYGRAGEFRLPAHGLEYRTLSNFWLRSYQLMSLVMGLSRLSCCILQSEISYKNNVTQELFGRVDMKQIEEAINKNDFRLAWRNWQGVRDFLDTFVPKLDCGLDSTKTEDFEYFAKTVRREGIERWFPLDPITHWASIPEGHGTGWESYLHGAVAHLRQEDMLAKALIKLKARK